VKNSPDDFQSQIFGYWRRQIDELGNYGMSH
jgi:hypothetical protein